MKKNTFEEKYEYIENEPITSGGYGLIYRIRDKKVSTEYVLKKIRKNDPNANAIGTTKETFENELKFLIEVKGTNIINIIDYYLNENDKYYYLILEKMDKDLNGLKIMIKKKKTHRDLKPSNILFSYTNDKETDFIVKIGDFGLSTDLKDTKIASNTGTEYFKAPEVVKEKYSNKCDLYSIGIILYFLKTGEYIFDGVEKVDVLNNKKINKMKKDTDDEKLNRLIKKLVVIDPHERMEWKDYFEDPFFKENDEDVKENEECKIKS